ncbi:LPD25 domain-containing protein [Oscillospiraceae bacterium LCP25S3_F9]
MRKGDNLRRDNLRRDSLRRNSLQWGSLHTVNSEEQVNTEDEKAEVKNQTSAFSISQQDNDVPNRGKTEKRKRPTIMCEWSESSAFEDGKTYTVSEFDRIMKQADGDWLKQRQYEIDTYDNDTNKIYEAYEKGEIEEVHLGYAKTKFNVNMPDGTVHTFRQDIGDGDGGVIDFLKQYPEYAELVKILEADVNSGEQVNTSDEKAEVKNQTSAFFIPQQDIDEILANGSGFENGKYRIYEQFQKQLPLKANAEFIKKEYGIGGRYPAGGNDNYNLDYRSSGVIISQRLSTNRLEFKMNWEQVAQRIGLLIHNDRYLNDKEKERYAAWLSEKKLKEVSQKTEPTEKKNNNPALYKYTVKDKVYLGSSNYEISYVDDNVVRLHDVQFPLLDKEMLRSDFDKRISENSLDEHLKAVDEQRISELPAEPKSDKINFSIVDENLGIGTKSVRYKNNIAAIETLKKIELENRYATAEEQQVLSQYVGWGGLSEYFDKDDSELKNILTESELEAARNSSDTAFYTPPVVIEAIYQALDNLGFKNGNILEPSCGIGNFMGLLPASMQSSKMYGVELDDVSGRIAKQLYPRNNIVIGGYENQKLPDSFFDVAVGNVPFGDFKLSDKRYNKLNFLVHDYFFAKTIDKVRPGGVIAFITSSGTLDKKNNRVRKYIAERATLLGAIRLPNNAFKGAAGTEVTSDIIFLQKKEAISIDNPDWLYLKENADGILVNQYFADNPNMVLGSMQYISGPFGKKTACIADTGNSLKEQLQKAVSKIQGHIPEQLIDFEGVSDKQQSMDNTVPANPDVKNYSYTVVDGDIYFRKDSIMVNANSNDIKKDNRIKGMIAIRDCVRELIDYQLEDYPESDIQNKRAELNKLYDNFKVSYGMLNSVTNKRLFKNDSSATLLNSLEHIDDNGNFIRKADIFSKRTVKAIKVITHTDNTVDALAVSLNEKGVVDIDYMAQLTDYSTEKVISDLKGIIYRVPNTSTYQTADEYLSGNVREKLFIAKNAAANDDSYKDNVIALEAVQPKDLEAGEVNVRLGATWIKPEYIKRFIIEVLKPAIYNYSNIEVHYNPITTKWTILGKGADRNTLSTEVYGTEYISAYYLLEKALNLKTDIKIYDEDSEGNKIINERKTTVARKKQEKLGERFQEWIFADQQRRQDVMRTYNDTFNAIRNREYDGSHLRFPGMNPEITLRPHQVNAIARTLYGGNSLLAHVVGAGKTFEMVASAMEAKHIGLCNKSLFVVPNNIVGQLGADFLRLYPTANILVATKADFEKNKRKEFCSRIATGDYDAVIIAHSQFEKIPISKQRKIAFLENEKSEILEAIREAKSLRGERLTVKQLVSAQKRIDKQLSDLYDLDEKKDDVVTFEQLGVDRLYVDEAHKFKNLQIRTKMTNVAGITSSSAEKSADLLMKCRYIDEITHNKGIVFATGTPVSNSMSELYTMQRYLQNDTLKKLGFSSFDAWASTFGSTVTALELAPEGKGFREKTRFSKFYNLPELMSIYREVADIQTADMIKLPVPEYNIETVVAKPSEQQKAYVENCAERADRVRNRMVDPTEDNMLKITTDGRKLAVDQRLVDPTLPDYAGSKVNLCVEKVYNIWIDNCDRKSTQIIFCDLSTPANNKFNVYDDIKNKLIAKGIPANEIAFIHNCKTDTQKETLFKNVRAGNVRILLGSTEKMGAGTNVQDKLIALHDLDCPWRPSDLEQRMGRIVRQGNENKKVNIYRYITEGTFDAYSYQIIENKQKFIAQIMSSKTPVREAEDIDQSALNYAEIKMLATGNPLIKERMELDIKQTRLKVLKADFLNAKYRIEDNISSGYPKQIATYEAMISRFNKDLITANEHPVDNEQFMIQLNGSSYTNKKEAGMMLNKIINDLPHRVNTDDFSVGIYRGFDLAIGKRNNLTVAILKGENNYIVDLSDDIFGNLTRINNKLEKIPAALESVQNSISKIKNDIDVAKLEAQKPFPQEEELKQTSDRLEKINAMVETMNNDFEFKQVTRDELQRLQNADIDLKSINNEKGFVIRYDKADRAAVESVLSNNQKKTLSL